VWRSGYGAALLVGRSRDRFPVVLLDFLVTYSFRPYQCTGVDSAPSENDCQEHFLGVKAAGVWGWQPHHLRVPKVMEIWSLNLLKPSGQHRACYGTPLRFTLSVSEDFRLGFLSILCRCTSNRPRSQRHILVYQSANYVLKSTDALG
jgi:hypothetical protein